MHPLAILTAPDQGNIQRDNRRTEDDEDPGAPEAPRRRGGRVVEGARLESVYTGNRIAGSNPAPSASYIL